MIYWGINLKGKEVYWNEEDIYHWLRQQTDVMRMEAALLLVDWKIERYLNELEFGYNWEENPYA